MNYILQFKNKLNSLTEYKYFDEIFPIVLAIITFLGWVINSSLGMSILIIIAILALIVKKDLKYVVPIAVLFIFNINEGFANDKLPISVMVLGTIFIVTLLAYTFAKGFKVSKLKNAIGLFGLAICNIIPIFWADNIPKGNEVFYLFFFANLGYFILYCIFVNGIGKNAVKILIYTLVSLGVVLTLQCTLRVLELRNTVDNIFKLWYYLGWGLCNEAGMIICMCLPFLYHLIYKSTDYKKMAIYQFITILYGVGILLTTSRGALLFFISEYLALYFLGFYFSVDRKKYMKFSLWYLGIIGLISLICIIPLINLIKDIINNMFDNGFTDNYRFDMWMTAFQNWILNPRNIIFGPGFTCVIDMTNTSMGFQLTPIVFHSTIFETMAIGGLLGIIFLVIHFYEKYRLAIKLDDKALVVCTLVSFIFIDIYGLIDNTYHMYYYMIILVIILCVFSNTNNQVENLNE